MKGHKGHHHGRHHKKAGGSVEIEGEKESYGGGDPAVVREAEEKKHGGRAKHGKHHRKHGGKVEGKHMKHRMDRASGGAVGRKRGGRVGADTAPLSSAHNTASEARLPKEEEGGLSA